MKATPIKKLCALALCEVLVACAAVGSARLVLADNGSAAVRPYCGNADWTIVNQKSGAKIFAGKADCTKVESDGFLESTMTVEGRTVTLQIWYHPGPGGTCKDDAVTVTIEGPDGLNYGTGGNPPPPGSYCNFSVREHPTAEHVLPGSLRAVLGKCAVLGGCVKPSDYELVKVDGSFRAYDRD